MQRPAFLFSNSFVLVNIFSFLFWNNVEIVGGKNLEDSVWNAALNLIESLNAQIPFPSIICHGFSSPDFQKFESIFRRPVLMESSDFLEGGKQRGLRPIMLVNANGSNIESVIQFKHLIKDNQNVQEIPLARIIILGTSSAYDEKLEIIIKTEAIVPSYWFKAAVGQKELVNVQKYCPNHQMHQNLWKRNHFVLKWQDCPFNFKHREILVSAFGLQPYIIYNGNTISGGTDVDIVNVLSESLSFKYKFKLESTWLDQCRNSTKFFGSIPSVSYEQSVMGIGNMIIAPGMAVSGIDFASITNTLDMVLVVPKAAVVSPYWNLVKPYHWLVWVAILGSFVMVYITFAFTDTKEIWDWIGSLVIFGKLCGQSEPVHFNTISSQLIFFFWLIFCVIVVASYECNLRSYLMSVDFESSINSDKDIIALDRKLMFPHGTSFHLYYLTSPLGIQRKIAQRIDFKTDFYTYEGGLQPMSTDKRMIENGDATIIGGILALPQLAQIESRHGYQPFRIAKEPSFFFFNTILLQIGKPWNYWINYKIRRIYEAGLVLYFNSRNLPLKYQNAKSLDKLPNVLPTPFKIEHFFLAIIIYASGMFLAWITFSAEKVLNKNIKVYS